MRSALIALLISTSLPVAAGETRWWRTDAAEEFLAGRGAGVAVTASGHLEAVDPWVAAETFSEPVAMAGGRFADGAFAVATGHPAMLYRVDRRSAEALAELPGEQATAVLVQGDDTVWVATMAPGRLLRWRDGDLDEVGRLEDGAFWALAEVDGRVVAAGGPPATLYRVGAEGLERWSELPDVFARCLAVDGDTLMVGTSGEGLIVAVDREGRQAILVDSPFTEISAIVPAGDGSLWATALVGEPAPRKTAPKNGNGGDGGEGNDTESAGLNLDLPKVGSKTATSEVLRITPEGGLLSVHRFTKQVATALSRDGDGILVGTGYEGEIWRFVDSGGARMATLDAVQAVAFLGGGEALLAQGPAALFRRTTDDDAVHRFRSGTEKWEQPVRFGRFGVIGDGDPGRIRFRSGAASTGDATWLEWTPWRPAREGRVDVPFGRVLQWEVEVPPGTTVEAVEVAWLEINMAPRVKELVVEDPGVVYLAAPPPSGPVIRQDHPTADGVFTTMGATSKASPASAKGKKYYQVGYRTVGWTVDDPNRDPLRFDLALESADGSRLSVRRDLEVTVLAVDTTAVPDGRYRFRLTATDAPANPLDPGEAEAVSPWFTVDATPPTIAVDRGDDGWTARVRDASPLTRVEVSMDAERWQAVAPEDGILDGGLEEFRISGDDGAGPAMIRAFDRHHNRTTVSMPR
jgi:hypothetical protein